MASGPDCPSHHLRVIGISTNSAGRLADLDHRVVGLQEPTHVFHHTIGIFGSYQRLVTQVLHKWVHWTKLLNSCYN